MSDNDMMNPNQNADDQNVDADNLEPDDGDLDGTDDGMDDEPDASTGLEGNPLLQQNI